MTICHMPFQKGNKCGAHRNHARGFKCRNLDQLKQMRWIRKNGQGMRVSVHEADQYIAAGWQEGRPSPSEESRQKMAASQRNRTDRIPASPTARLNTWYKCRYNRTLDDYEAVLKSQGGHCALCPAESSGKKRLCWDHDHACCPGLKSCGECVRGLLCIACNKMIGHLETLLIQGENSLSPKLDTWLFHAINYLEKYKK